MLNNKNKDVKRILLTGGGTGGSVVPLLAVADTLRDPLVTVYAYEFLWLGTKDGPERSMVEESGIEFRAIPAGKLRRYWARQNLTDPFLVIAGLVRSWFIIRKWQPDLVMTAGSFASVPVVWAAWLARVPVIVHQQDARPGLANRLMAPVARVVTVTFEKSLKHFRRKSVWTGNPVRREIRNKELLTTAMSLQDKEQKRGQKMFQLEDGLPVILILGGGTGAMAINKLVWKSLDRLIKFCQVIHITGGSKKFLAEKYGDNPPARYHHYGFLEANRLAAAYAAADAVITRCGMGVLSELSYLGKPSILIPIPDSHQEENASVFYRQKAAVVLDQKELTPSVLISAIRRILKDQELCDKLRSSVKKVIKTNANVEIAEIINDIIEWEARFK